MKVLGISTAGKLTSVAVIEETQQPQTTSVLCEYSSLNVRSEDVIVLIDRICKDTGLDIKEIDAIAVVDGPGSYSGLRGGLAAAKSLAQALEVPVCGVSALEATAYNLKNAEGAIAVVSDAVRDESNFALFSSDSKNVRRLSQDMPLPKARIKELLKQIKGKLHIPLEQDEYPYARNAALIGLAQLKAGLKDDYLSLVPRYSHVPNIREYKK